jgi:outer membrane protein TolC
MLSLMKKILLAFCLAGFALLGNAQQITLDECLKLARENYPEIRKYDLIRQSAGYTVSNANMAWVPQVSLSGQATWQNKVPALPDALTGILEQNGLDIPGLQKDQYRVQVDVSQVIWDGGMTKANNELTKANAEADVLSTDVDLYDIDGRVEDLYFGALLLDEKLRQTESTIKLLQVNLDKINSLYSNGEAMKSDADAVEAQLLSVNQQKTQIEASRESYRKMLEIFIGKSLDSAELVLPEAEVPLYSEPARKELDLIDAKVRALDAQEKVVKASTMPQFGFFAQGYYGYPGMDYFNSMLNDDWSWNAILGVRMTWNFGNFYTKKNSLRKIQSSRMQAEVQRDVFIFNNRLQASQETDDIQRLRKTIEYDDKIVELRTSVRKAAESKLRNGIIDTTDLLGKITDESNAISDRDARKIELVKSIYELKHTVNK